MLENDWRRQVFAAVMANLSTFAFGIAAGWSSPNLPLLQSLDTPLATKQVLTQDEASWVGSLYLIGGTVGSLFFGWLGGRLGKKKTLITSAFAQTASWLILEFGSTVGHLCWARFLVGFGGGGCFVIIPVYVAEIASDKIRGGLGALISVACNLGIVTGYVINGYLDYYTVPFIVMSIFAVFFLGFPLAMTSKGYQPVTPIPEELQTLRDVKPKLTMYDLTTKSARKAIIIGIYLNFLGIGNGIVAVNNYSQTIFSEAGSSLTPKVSTIVIGVILLIGACLSSIFCDRAGRKPLMCASSTGCGVSLAILAVYAKLKPDGYEWIPLCCLSLYMLLGSIGIMSLYYAIVSEVLSPRIRGIVTTVCLIENWLLAFLLAKFFPVMLAAMGMHGCLLCFALVCFSGTFFVGICLPETKGKRIEEIVKALEG